MAGLQLVPNPTILAIQAGVFVGAILVVKKLYVEPYLKLKDKRDAATTGNKDQASDLLAKNESDKEAIKQRLSQASSEAATIMAAAKREAGEERDRIIAAASSEAKEKMKGLSAEIAQKLQQERARIPEIVAGLSKTVFEKALR